MNKTKVVLLVVSILALAVFLRTWHLNSIPPGLYPDEAINGNNALQAIKTGDYKVYYPENNGREGFFINLQAFSLKIFGVHIWSLILVSAIIGILTVLGIYFLTKELFQSTGIALLAMFFTATSFWHVNFSRIGFRAIMTPFCLVWSFYFLFKTINLPSEKKNRNWLSLLYLVLSGIFLGLGFHTYIAFRMVVIVLIVPLIMILVRFFKEYKLIGKFWDTFFKKGFWQYKIWILATILVALPIGLYFLHNPQDFIGRASGISVFNKQSPAKVIIESTIKTLGMFNVVGDKNWRHNFSGSPQLFWPVGILFLVGIIFSIKKTKQGIHLFLLVWFGAMLLPAILTAEGLPHALRVIGAVPVCYIFAASGAYIVYKFLSKFEHLKRGLLFLFCFLFLFLCAYYTFDKYFFDWAKQPAVEDSFAKNFVEIGEYLNNLPKTTNNYVIVNQSGVLVPVEQNGKIKDIPMPSQTIVFVRAFEHEENKPTQYLLPEEIDTLKLNKDSVVIPLQYDIGLFRKLKNKFPQGQTKFENNIFLFKL
jgi:4-amino-4-deoxy-L-arabinose transferase-like glycosyltransferase